MILAFRDSGLCVFIDNFVCEICPDEKFVMLSVGM